ncbi:MAG: NADH-quinone oxidoreductase subunit N [Anaerolineae bacterium]|nr:NADH-quinone oxidoreductase subunit N [Thermoflexales bacterium]MDW8395958.1 NADH-quinone oxidoreductase subunit N [Anaerolineae bacterium]
MLADLVAIFPFLVCALGGVALLLIDLRIPSDRKAVTAWVALVIVLAAGLSALAMLGTAPREAFSRMVRADAVALFADALLCAVAALTILLTLRYHQARRLSRGEFYPLLLLSLSGMVLTAHANDLLIVFLGIELLSIPLYVLSGIARPRLESEESAMKYFFTGAFASGFLVYGIALVYGAMGTTSLSTFAAQLRAALGGSANDPLLLAGLALVLVGLAFKVAAAPFHLWAPDVYEGAPTTVTAFMATATKTAGFLALVRVFGFGFAALQAQWQPVIAALAALTMVVGNFAALAQTNLKRLLAYSSIAHAGYALVGVAANDAQAVLFYLAAYAFTTLAAFAVLTAIGSGVEENQGLDAYAGLGRTQPALGVVMAVAMFSLIGIPPTAGFVGKYFLFQSAVAAGLAWLALFGVLTSVVSAYFYLRVVMTLYMREPQGEPVEVVPDAPRTLAAALSVAAVLVFGVGAAAVIGFLNDGLQAMRP